MIAAARAAADKKAEHFATIDVSEQLGFIGVFLLVSGTNDRHVHAIVNAVDEVMHRAGAKRRTQEGSADTHWVLVDYGDVIVHILQNENREFCSLERLWKDCPVIELPADLVRGGSQDGDSLDGWEITAL